MMQLLFKMRFYLCLDPKKTIGPETVFHYLYSQLHSKSYRTRYSEFLSRDFPCVFLTDNLTLFRDLCQLGADLAAFHFMEEDYASASWKAGNGPLSNPRSPFICEATPEVAKGYPKFMDGNIFINKLSFFTEVPKEVWEYCIGGYQICHKWLKDRGPKKGNPGRILTQENIAHYQKIIVALNETIHLMDKIDKVIEKHGGWPDAFITKNGDE